MNVAFNTMSFKGNFFGQTKAKIGSAIALKKTKPITRDEFKRNCSLDDDGSVCVDGKKFTGKVTSISGGEGEYILWTDKYNNGRRSSDFDTKEFIAPEFPKDKITPSYVNNPNALDELTSMENYPVNTDNMYFRTNQQEGRILDMFDEPYSGVIIEQKDSDACEYIQQAVFYNKGIECARSEEVHHDKKELKPLKDRRFHVEI